MYLTIYRGDKLPRRYIGSTYVNRVYAGYNGSVKSKAYKTIYEDEQKRNKHLFRTRILKTYETHVEAQIEELRLQKKYDVVKSSYYFNMSYAQPNGCFGRDTSGNKHPFWNKEHNEATCNKISVTLKNKFESGELVSPFKFIDVSGCNNPFWNKAHSEDSKVKMRKPKSHVPKWNCPFCQKLYDGGNLTQHMRRKHAWTDNQINQLKVFE